MIEIERIKLVIQENSKNRINSSMSLVPSSMKNLTEENWIDIIYWAIKNQLSIRNQPSQPSFFLGSELDEKVRLIAKLFSGDSNRRGIIIQGTLGNGKTIILNSLWSIYMAAGESCKIIPAHLFLDLFSDAMIRGEYSSVNYYRFSNYLFLDDLGCESENCVIFGTYHNPIQQLIYNRYDNLLPTFITTNLSDSMLAERYGERVFDRLQEMCAFLRLSAPSYRK